MKSTFRELQAEFMELNCILKRNGGLETLTNLFELLKNQNHNETLEELERLENKGNIAQGLIDLGRAITLSKQRIEHE
jgi:hypothetical protein